MMSTSNNSSTSPTSLHEFQLTGEYGDFSIVLYPSMKPIWRGNFEFGPVSIYRAEIEGAPSLPLVAFIHILEDTAFFDTKPTQVRWNLYKANAPLSQVMNSLIMDIRDIYSAILTMEVEDRKFNGTYSLQ